MDRKSVTEKSRDRIERRTAYTTTDVGWLLGKEKWKNLCCIGAIKTEFERKGTKTEEWHYYISSRDRPGVKSAVQRIRHHHAFLNVQFTDQLLDRWDLIAFPLHAFGCKSDSRF